MRKINWKKIGQWLANIILVIIFLIGIFIVVTFLPIKNNYKIFAVKSGSMEPKIKIGSLIVIQPQENYQVGDIVSFHSEFLKTDKDVITHRIDKITEQNGLKLYSTKGDANQSADLKQTPKDQIIGKYRFKIPFLGYILSFIKTATGLILIIIIPGTIIIYEELKKIRQESQKIIKNRKDKSKKGKNDDKNK